MPVLLSERYHAVSSSAIVSGRMAGNPLHWLRRVGFLEGVSFLVLLLIAMPLKYIWDMPGAVRVVGMAHGLLFTAYVVMVMRAVADDVLDRRQGIRCAVASVLPFGPFVVDRELHALAERMNDPANERE